MTALAERPGEPLEQGRVGTQQGPNSFAIFVVLWAVAVLFQLSSVLQWFINLTPPTLLGAVETLVAGAALAVLFRPTSVRRLCVLVAAQVASTLVALPEIPNHRLITTFVGLIILVSLGRRAWTTRRAGDGKDLERFAPALRVLVLIVYGFAALAKINWDFFDPVVSCASRFLGEILPQAGTTGLLGTTAVASAVLVEVSLPFLLAWRRTRHLGVLLAFGFHIFLTLHPTRHFFDFSSTMLALLVLFVAPGVLRAATSSIRLPSYRTVRNALVAGFGVVWIAGLLSAYSAAPTSAALVVFGLGRYLLWFPYALVLLVLLVIGLRRHGREPSDVRMRVSSRLALALLVLAVLNGLAPYVGLKTRSSFDMYSNLRVEGATSNHVFVPELDMFSYQDDLVRIVESSDQELESAYADDGFLMPFFEFQSYAASHPEISVTYERAGETITIDRVGDDPTLSSPTNPVLRKLLWFRPVDAGAQSRCQW